MRSPLRPLLRCLLFAALWTAFAVAPVRAQEEGLLQLDDDQHRFLIRQQAAGRLPSAHLTHRPLSAYEAGRYLDSLARHRDALSPDDRRLLDRFQGTADGPGTDFVHRYASFLYPDGRHLFSTRSDRYAVQIDPLFNFSYGRARRTEREGRDAFVPVWQNTRGVRAAGHIGRYVFFETRLRENQRRDPRPSSRQETAARLAQTRFIDGNTYDYFRAEGVLGFRSRHFEVRFGRERNHWGPGRTSLFLSDYAAPYDQLQIRTTFWRIQYTNVFASMTDLTPLPESFGDRELPSKFGAFHRLAFDLPAGVQLALYEGVVFAPEDSSDGRRLDFELSYLNPIIFYRAVERDLGSPDNVLLGAGASWQAADGLQLYGQFMLDEFVIDEIFTDSWRNKYGLLLGARLADLPVDGLLLNLEYARLRPYLYAHDDPSTSFTHFNDLLGHPAGPNAEDFALFADYRITPRIDAGLSLAYTRRGRADSLNVGADPLQSYRTRRSDQAPFLDGVRQNSLLLEARAAYELLPGLHLEAALRAQSVDDGERGLDRYVAPFVSLRWGVPFRSARY